MFDIFDKKFKTININLNRELVAGMFYSGTMKLRDKIGYWKSGVIKRDPDNRGNGRLDNKKVNDIARDWNIIGLGTFPIEDQGDGTFKMVDAHHREAATMKRLIEMNGISEEDLDKNVQVLIAPKGLGDALYAYIGNTRGVTTRQDILHKRKGLGNLLTSILERQTIESSVEEKFYQTIARCVYGYAGKMEFDVHTEYVSFSDISKDRNTVNNDAKLTMDDYDFSLSEKQISSIVEAIDYLNETYFEFKAIQNISSRKGKVKLSETSNKLLSSVGLYGFLLWDRLSGRQVITDVKPKTLATRLAEKDASVENTAIKLMNSRERDASAKKLVTLLNAKNVLKLSKLSVSVD